LDRSSSLFHSLNTSELIFAVKLDTVTLSTLGCAAVGAGYILDLMNR